ncbi:AraC family transcriptional regulator [Pseudoramibacter faecis]|uniref:AraC family transcriptional regulator n=1 Tax=Pseudoramibacter faecis TaxID=3108534 RepID=UPI002E78A74F|nr:AraC family transcriptional regulator [Pseudoramibacter sp. HA2172]
MAGFSVQNNKSATNYDNFANEQEFGKLSHLSINPSTMEETSQLNTEKFSYFSDLCRLEAYPDSLYPWHWHSALQFFRIIRGALDYSVPGAIYRFEKNDVGFINANTAHMVKGVPGSRCLFEEHLFQPSFLGGVINTNIMDKYVRPIVTNGNLYIYKFEQNSEASKRAATCMREAFELYTTCKPYFEIYIREKISRLWIEFLDASQDCRKNIQEKPSSDRLKTMVIFLNAHFGEEFSLKELADAAQCSIRECNRVFQIQMHTTPLAYLRLIRLQQACNLLLNTTKSITEIGKCCGFNSSSYFGKIFHQKYGISPSGFRKKYR